MCLSVVERVSRRWASGPGSGSLGTILGSSGVGHGPQAADARTIRPLGITLGDPRDVPYERWTTLVRVTASSSSGSATARAPRKTALTLTVRAGSSRQARCALACERRQDARQPDPVRAQRVGERDADADRHDRAARLAAVDERVVGGADEHRRRVEEARARQRLAAGQQLGAGVDGVLDLAVHPLHAGRRRSAGRARCRGRSPGRPGARAPGRSARRGTVRRPRGARARARPSRTTARRRRTRWRRPDRPPIRGRRRRRRSPGGCPRPPRPAAPRGRRPRASASGRAARSSPCSSVSTAPRSSSSTSALGGERRLLGRLEHDRVAGHQRGGERAAARGQRIAPRHQDRDHAARLAQHQVTARRPAALERAELGEGLEGGDRRPARRRASPPAASRPRASAAPPARARARAAGGRRPSAAPRAPRARSAPTDAARRARPRTARCASGAPPAGIDADLIARRGIDHGELGNVAGDAKIEHLSGRVPADRRSNTCGVRVPTVSSGLQFRC